jgi:hypothetical protein
MACSHFGLLLKVSEVVAVSPFTDYWIEGVKIIETLCVGT